MSPKVADVKPHLTRGVFVFMSGMALAGVSLLLENFVIKSLQGRG